MRGRPAWHAGGVANRTELGAFLRTRRDQLSPADVGLPAGGRRRAPGLRREEVAALAGISVDYLVRLEQGRDRNPSAPVLAALADALRLDDDERVHLLGLASCASSPEYCPASTSRHGAVPPTVQHLLDRLDPTPAVVLSAAFDVLAHNRTWERIATAIGLFDGPEPNLARFTFRDPRARAALPAWSEAADEQAAVLREAQGRWRGDEHVQAIIDELLGEPEFERRWRSYDVGRKARGTRVVVHPDAGPLRIDEEALDLVDQPGQRLLTWLSADDATEAAFRRLAELPEPVSPARLRVVGD